jgi:phage-related tail protein
LKTISGKDFGRLLEKLPHPRTLGENGVIVLTSTSEFWTAITMTEQIEKLAQQIASLEESDLQALLERIKELGFRHEINALSERYRKRLKDQVEIDEGAEKILAKLKEIRQEIASREYPG